MLGYFALEPEIPSHYRSPTIEELDSELRAAEAWEKSVQWLEGTVENPIPARQDHVVLAVYASTARVIRMIADEVGPVEALAAKTR